MGGEGALAWKRLTRSLTLRRVGAVAGGGTIPRCYDSPLPEAMEREKDEETCMQVISQDRGYSLLVSPL